MATVTGLTAARMLAIEASCIVDGAVVLDNLILTKQGGGTIDAGSVRGPIGTPGVSQAQLNTFMNDHLPIGSSIDFMGIVSPSVKWLAAIGQTIINGQTLYPDFWGVIPIGMKSGSDIIMPNTRGKVSVGYDSTDIDFDTIGEVGGAKTHQLTQLELPAVGIAVDPPNIVVSIDPPATNISVDPPATAVTGATGLEGAHSHGLFPGYPTQPKAVTTGTGWGGETPAGIVIGGSGYTVIENNVTGATYPNEHTHPAGTLAVNIPAFTTIVDIAPFNVNVNIGSFSSSNLGSGTPHSIIQPYIIFLKLIKVL